MSDSEEESFCFYGKSLEQFDEDAFPKKKPISVEEQIATDAQGRRRFHGAFTGGFSAGFYNTVGSLEGWKPSEFRSSRQEKAQPFTQKKPQDFMDDEDRSEFGIAPEVVKTTSDYEKNNKRKRTKVFADGPIPGEPVLHTLIESGNETVGYLLLKNIGLKNAEKAKESQQGRVYGCAMPVPSKYEVSRNYPVAEIPEIYKNYLKNPKDNSFGMGYVGLQKSHINLFQSSGIVSREKNKKGFSIKGQAFGVGAFEEDDDDIYAREDMSNYDFEITKEKTPKKGGNLNKGTLVLDMYIASQVPLINKTRYPPPNIPATFTGKHKVKGSRWDKKETQENDVSTSNVERKDMNTLIRSKYLGEDTTVQFTSSKKVEQERAANNVLKESSTSTSSNSSSNEDKHKKRDSEEKKGSFSTNLLFDKFVSASKADDHIDLMAPVEKSETTHGTQEMREAAKLKMFGPLTRTYLTWQPNALLCRRFNVPEPKFDDAPKRERKKVQLIFEYQKEKEDESVLKPGLSVKKEPESADMEVSEIIEEAEESSSNMQPSISSSAESIAQINLINTNINTNNNVQSTPSTSTTLNAPSTSTSSESTSVDDIRKKLNAPSTSTSSQSTSVDDIEKKLNAPSTSSQSTTVDDIEKNLNKSLDITDKVDVAKNIDLFKAVFLSSSEDESEDEQQEKEKDNTEETQRNELMKSNVLGETLIPKIQTSKPGILSNVDFSKIRTPNNTIKHEFIRPNKSKSEEDKDKNDKESTEENNDVRINGNLKLNVSSSRGGEEKSSSLSPDNNVYGPKLPDKLPINNQSKIITVDSSSDDEWIEKDKAEKKKSHKHKKRKKEKKKKHKKDKR